MAASCVGLILGGLTYEPDGHGMDLVGRFYRMIMRNAGENCCSSASSGLIVSVADLDTILREAHSARLVKNSAVFQQGEDAHSFFVLLHGHVRASHR